jgi:hypothetical protein
MPYVSAGQREMLPLIFHFFVCGHDFISYTKVWIRRIMDSKVETQKACHNRDTPCALEVVLGASNGAFPECAILAYEGSHSLKTCMKLFHDGRAIPGEQAVGTLMVESMNGTGSNMTGQTGQVYQCAFRVARAWAGSAKWHRWHYDDMTWHIMNTPFLPSQA